MLGEGEDFIQEDLKEPPRLPKVKKKFEDNPKEKKIFPEGKLKGPPRIPGGERRFSEGNSKELTSLPKRGNKILSGEYSKETPRLPEGGRKLFLRKTRR